MNHTVDLEKLKDSSAERRDKKKRPRMRVHGRNLKRTSNRPTLHISKIELKKRRGKHQGQ